jgi:hypothetical protein
MIRAACRTSGVCDVGSPRNPHGRHQAGDRHHKFHDNRDNLGSPSVYRARWRGVAR